MYASSCHGLEQPVVIPRFLSRTAESALDTAHKLC